MKQIIRMTESDLHNMISETVLRILTEGEGWEAFKQGFNAKGLGQYAKSRIWDGDNEHQIGQSSDEEKARQQNLKVKKHIENNGTIDNNGNLVGGSQSTQSSSENN